MDEAYGMEVTGRYISPFIQLTIILINSAVTRTNLIATLLLSRADHDITFLQKVTILLC